jgi:ribonuclease HI
LIEETLVELWTDGGCKVDTKEGSIGILLQYKGQSKEINGYFSQTTNNQMELLALIIALKVLKKTCKINVYVDSKYVKDGLETWIHAWKNNGWRSASKAPVKNQALWVELDKLYNYHSVKLIWVKGHSINENNNRVDFLCNDAIKNKIALTVDADLKLEIENLLKSNQESMK